jgi:hypothetical protein
MLFNFTADDQSTPSAPKDDGSSPVVKDRQTAGMRLLFALLTIFGP